MIYYRLLFFLSIINLLFIYQPFVLFIVFSIPLSVHQQPHPVSGCFFLAVRSSCDPHSHTSKNKMSSPLVFLPNVHVIGWFLDWCLCDSGLCFDSNEIRIRFFLSFYTSNHYAFTLLLPHGPQYLLYYCSVTILIYSNFKYWTPFHPVTFPAPFPFQFTEFEWPVLYIGCVVLLLCVLVCFDINNRTKEPGNSRRKLILEGVLHSFHLLNFSRQIYWITSVKLHFNSIIWLPLFPQDLLLHHQTFCAIPIARPGIDFSIILIITK